MKLVMIVVCYFKPEAGVQAKLLDLSARGNSRNTFKLSFVGFEVVGSVETTAVRTLVESNEEGKPTFSF